MKGKIAKNIRAAHQGGFFYLFLACVLLSVFVFFVAPATLSNIAYDRNEGAVSESLEIKSVHDSDKVVKPAFPPLDKVDYDLRLSVLANNPPPPAPIVKKVKQPDGSYKDETIIPEVKPTGWPVKTEYPKDGAILPFNRIVAYYGNLYSKKMGILGEYPEAEMLSKLKVEVEKWEAIDSDTPVLPALHYIAVVAQGSPGKDGKYRFRMPDSEIEKVLKMAEKINGIVFLDIQVGLSDLQSEIPYFEKYLKMSNVHLGIDPEFSMKTGKKPGGVIGTFDAADINYASDYLAKLVQENNLPPKVLIVHRFTENMVTNYKNIKTMPEVQIVMNMDGWGHHARKINTHKQFIYKQPVQFAGFKLFYKNDLKEDGSHMLTPGELMQISPRPIYIQYQ